MEAHPQDRSALGSVDQPSRRSGEPAAPSISFVLPAHNEAKTIRQAIREADVGLARITPDYEIIVVDDGSTDGTVVQAAKEAQRLDSVRLLRQRRNLGYGAALRRGFEAATKDLVGFTDADCQFDLTELDRLVMLAGRHDIVCGYRIDRQDPWSRRCCSSVYNLLARLLAGTGVRDCDCALKMFRREVIESLSLQADGFFFSTELLAKARLEGKSVVEVGVSHRPRAGGRSTVSCLQALPVGRDLLRFAWNTVLFPGAVGRDTQRPPAWPWRTEAALLLILAAVAALLLFLNLSYPLIEPDESRYAQIALELVESGNLSTPTLEGMPYLDKPPLLYWLTAASYLAFGVNEFAARLPCATAALLTVLTTYWLGRRFVGARAAAVGALLLLLCAGFVLSGRFLLMDGPLTLLATWCLLALHVGCRGKRFLPAWWVVAGTACGLGILTKGPIAVVLGVPPLLAFRWLMRPRPRLRWHHWLWFAGPALLVSLPWYAWTAAVHPVFAGHFFGQHHLVRFFSAFTHAQPWWFYVPVILVGMFPCSMLFPPLIAFLTSRAAEHRQLRSPELGYLVLAAAWIVGFLSLSSCKLPTYVLPAVPLLCLLTGRMIDAALLDRSSGAYFKWVSDNFSKQATMIVLAVGLALGVAGLLLGAESERLVQGVFVSGAVLLLLLMLFGLRRSPPAGAGGGVGAAGPFAASRLGILGTKMLVGTGTWLPPRSYTAWMAAAAVSLAVMAYGFGDFFPQLCARRSIHVGAVRLRESFGGQPLPVVYIGHDRFSATFHMRRADIRYFDDHEQDGLKAFISQHPRVVIVTRTPIGNLAHSLGPRFELAPAGGQGRVYLSRRRQPAAVSLGGSPRQVRRAY